jgi:hypothetical protein
MSSQVSQILSNHELWACLNFRVNAIFRFSDYSPNMHIIKDSTESSRNGLNGKHKILDTLRINVLSFWIPFTTT